MTAEAQAVLQAYVDLWTEPDGRIARVITFWGALPPVPCSENAP